MAAVSCKVTDGLNIESIQPIGDFRCYGGNGAFSGSGTSVTVYIPADANFIFMPQITPVLAASAAAAANGQLTVGGVSINADGTLKPTTAGQITVYRAAGTDSGLTFSFFTLWG